MKDPKILIIGNGGAAAYAVLAARAFGHMGTISIVSGVNEPAFGQKRVDRSGAMPVTREGPQD
ncbi:MAG: hypothetical protein JRC68_06670 [Deltaproteobacteria bacterium]|nr:hypothetical protein [Deltaproteobacteria bacterium]